MKGVQIVYDFAKTRKFSGTAGMEKTPNHLRPPDLNLQGIPETPGWFFSFSLFNYSKWML